MTNKNTYKGKRIGHKMPVNTLPNITVENEHTFTPEQVEKHVRELDARWEKVEQMYDKCYLLGNGEDNNIGVNVLFDPSEKEWSFVVWALDLANKECKTRVAYLKRLADTTTTEQWKEITTMTNYTPVTTTAGTEIDLSVAIELMDDEIREELHAEMAGDCTAQEFYAAYCEAHLSKFGEPFICDDPLGQW